MQKEIGFLLDRLNLKSVEVESKDTTERKMQAEINFLLKQLNGATEDAQKLKKELEFLVK